MGSNVFSIWRPKSRDSSTIEFIQLRSRSRLQSAERPIVADRPIHPSERRGSERLDVC